MNSHRLACSEPCRPDGGAGTGAEFVGACGCGRPCPRRSEVLRPRPRRTRPTPWGPVPPEEHVVGHPGGLPGRQLVKDSPASRVASRRTLRSMRSYCGMSWPRRPAIVALGAGRVHCPLMHCSDRLRSPVPIGEPTIGSPRPCRSDRSRGPSCRPGPVSAMLPRFRRHTPPPAWATDRPGSQTRPVAPGMGFGHASPVPPRRSVPGPVIDQRSTQRSDTGGHHGNARRQGCHRHRRRPGNRT